MLQRSSGGNYPAITADQLMRILIPIPQSSITKPYRTVLYQSAYAQKKQKEQEANTLLDSIDDYMLTELGIEKPQQKENSIENRIFTTTSSEVFGGRFDSRDVLSGLLAAYEILPDGKVSKLCPHLTQRPSYFRI